MSADFFRLFKNQCVETQLVAPTCCGKTGRTGADNDYVVHFSFVLLCALATWREQSTSISRKGAKTQRRDKISNSEVDRDLESPQSQHPEQASASVAQSGN